MSTAHTHEASPSREPFAPPVSILLLMKNERSNLEQHFDRIEGQDYPGPVEYIYIDSGSIDGTIEFMRERGIEAHIIKPDLFHHGCTRNLAASLAQHEILVLLSGDACPVDTAWLSRLVRHFRDPRVGAVYGRQIPPEGMHPVRRRMLESEYGEGLVIRDPKTIEHWHPGLFRFSNANAAVRTEFWRRFRWSESVLLAEDQGLCRDALLTGYCVVYDPEAAVIHGHERSLWGEFTFAVDNGLSLTRLGILNNPELAGEFRYGLRKMREDTTFFLRRHEWGHALRAFTVCVVKWVGVQFGKRERKLPRWLLRRISGGYDKLYK